MVLSRNTPQLRHVFPKEQYWGHFCSYCIMHINDLPSVVDPGTSVRLFADDTLIYRVIHSMEDQVTLQRDLARLEQWAESWGMVFSAS